MDKRVSASRVGAMLGMDSWCSPLTLYHRMRGELPEQSDNEMLLEGREFEGAIARIASWKYGLTVEETDLELAHGPLSGHPDRLFVEDGKRGVLEIKNTVFGAVDSGDWGEPGTDQVPRSYYIQTTVYAWLYKQANPDAADFAYLAARLHGGVRLYKIPIDPEIIEVILNRASDFLAMVDEGCPPDPINEQDCRNLFLADQTKSREVDSGIMAMIRMLRDTKAQIKALEEQESQLKFRLLEYAQDASVLDYTDSRGVTRTVARLAASRSFDAEACLADHPGLLAHYAKLDTTRLAKENKALYERYMRLPQSALEQTRIIRLSDKAIEAIES